jgi:hypothetical protein
MSTTATKLTIIQTLENYGHEALSLAQHGAAWLVGECAKGSTALAGLEASSPWIESAIQAGTAAANAHGIPMVALEGIGSEILALAKELANGLSAPAPGVAVTPAPAVGA